MSTVGTRRWEQDGTVWFEVEVTDSDLVDPAARLLMEYERSGIRWRHCYPAETPHLESAWQNFARDIEKILRQAARAEPIPWREALRELCCRTGAAQALGEAFGDAMIEPVLRSDDGQWISDWWGRAFVHARIEWIGDPRPFADDPDPADFGLVAAQRLETVPFEDWLIKVPPLDLQRAVNERRGLADRVAMIDDLIR